MYSILKSSPSEHRLTLHSQAVCIAYFVQLFDIVASGAYSRTVATAVGTTADKAVWIPQVIVIVTAALGPPASQMADYWGRKWIFVGSSVFGLVGAIIFARANSIGQVVAGQTISSVFFVSQPILIAVASEILPRKWRPAAQAGLNAAGGVGGVVAFLGGQALIDMGVDGWRNIWYVVTALMGFSGLVIAVLYWPPPMPLQKTLTTSEKFRRLDWIGYFLLATCLTLLCMGLSFAESPYPWDDAHVVAPIVAGGALLIALIVHQTFFQKHGLLDHDLFKKDRNFALGIACFCMDGMIFWAYTAYFPFQMSVNYHYNRAVTEGARNCMVSRCQSAPKTGSHNKNSKSTASTTRTQVQRSIQQCKSMLGEHC
jgi:MFS family permease